MSEVSSASTPRSSRHLSLPRSARPLTRPVVPSLNKDVLLFLFGSEWEKKSKYFKKATTWDSTSEIRNPIHPWGIKGTQLDFGSVVVDMFNVLCCGVPVCSCVVVFQLCVCPGCVFVVCVQGAASPHPTHSRDRGQW